MQDDFDWAGLNGKPLVYCSLGTNAHFYESPEGLLAEIGKALSMRRDFQLVVHGGRHLTAADLPTLPDDAIVAARAPQLALLEKAALFITHAGLGAVKEAIHFGVPMLAFPMAHDQHFNAENIARLGLGVTGDAKDLSAGSIARKLDCLARGNFKRSVEAIHGQIEDSTEFAQGIEVIAKAMRGETVLEPGGPTRRARGTDAVRDTERSSK